MGCNDTELLRQIARNTAGETGDDVEVSRGLATIDGKTYQIKETDNLDNATDDGTVVLSPGDDKTLARATSASGGGIAGFAFGATDSPDVEYYIYVDSTRVIGGATNSPLGTINDPFSFPDTLNAKIKGERRIEYRAKYAGSATGDIELAARMHVEQL